MATDRRSEGAQASRRPVAMVALGLLTTVLVFILLLVPVIVTLLLPPVPRSMSVPVAIAVFAAIGVVVGLVLTAAGTRPLYAGTIAVVLAIIALWLQRGTWLPAPFLPPPPNLPHVPPTVTLVTGAFIAAALVAAASAGRGRHSADGTSSIVSAGLGALGAASVVVVAEADAWGLGVFQRTLQGPFGMGRFTWLAVIFFGGLAAGALVGWVATSQRYRPMAPVVGTLLIAAVTVASLGRITGPPRTTLYGLALGVLLLAALAGYRRAPARSSRTVDAD